MIEYAIRKTDGKQVQIGNCENIYGLRYEDRNKVIASPGCTSHTQTLNLHWRLPFPEEDHILPGEYRDRGRTRKSYPLHGYVLSSLKKYYTSCFTKTTFAGFTFKKRMVIFTIYFFKNYIA